MLSIDQVRRLKDILRATSAPLAYDTFQDFAQAVLDPLIELTRSKGGNLYVTDGAAGGKPVFLWHSHDPGFVADYQREFYRESPIRLMLPRDVHVGQSCEFVDYDDFRKTAFYGEFLAPRRLHHLAALVSRIPAAGARKKKLAVVGLQKKTGADPFTEEDLQILELLVSPVEAALHTLLVAGSERGQLAQAFDAMPVGVLVLDWKLSAVYRNPALDDLLDARELTDAEWESLRVLASRTKQSYLAPSDEEPSAFDRSWTTRAGRALELRASVLPEGLLSPKPHVLCLVEKPAARVPRLEPEALRDAFGLTAREAEIVGRCVLGETNAQIASALGISAETVKQHLKTVFHKTGVERRTQLAALLAAL